MLPSGLVVGSASPRAGKVALSWSEGGYKLTNLTKCILCTWLNAAGGDGTSRCTEYTLFRGFRIKPRIWGQQGAGFALGLDEKGETAKTRCRFCTLHLPPCTLHLAPGTLHPAPGTSRLAPCTLHLPPCTLHLAPCTLHPAPGTSRLAPCTLHLAPCTWHPAPCTLHPAPGTSRLAPCALPNDAACAERRG